MSLLTTYFVNLDSLSIPNDYGLKRCSPKYKYVDGEKTEEVEAIKYTVVNSITLDTMNISVNHKKALFSIDEIEDAINNKQIIKVSFINARVRAYYNTFSKKVEDSIIADDIKMISK